MEKSERAKAPNNRNKSAQLIFLTLSQQLQQEIVVHRIWKNRKELDVHRHAPNPKLLVLMVLVLIWFWFLKYWFCSSFGLAKFGFGFGACLDVENKKKFNKRRTFVKHDLKGVLKFIRLKI